MSAPRVDLERLAELARQDAPAALEPAAAARLVAAAVQRATVIRPRRGRRSPRLLAAGVLVLAFAAGAAATLVLVRAPASRPVAPGAASAASDMPPRFELPGGDRVLATPGARLQVASAERAARRLVLREGTALFDVAPLGPGTGFAVETSHAHVDVVGTVFTITTTREHTIVRVYEGHVRVSAAGRVIELEAGETWASDGPPGGADPLFGPARRAADEREAAAPRVTTLAPPPGEAPLSPEEYIDAPPLLVPEDYVDEPPLRRAQAPAPVDPALAEIRGWISIGEAERARAAAAERARADVNPGPWRLLEADALRALGRYAEAADTYDLAARLLPARGAAQAGYLAAFLRLERLGDAAGALASLDASAADAPGAPLEERARLLRSRALGTVLPN